MIVLRGNPDDVARVRQIKNRGLLAWLYGDGILIIPPDMDPPTPGEEDHLLRDMQRALTEPIEGNPL